ncbi:MAG: hypothetical protein HY735_15205 [Verrucomicrobia bacterium]|nr:hypothetical protein [Verrucomicrobiota bacterium]
MKTKRAKILVVKGSAPPAVEVDSEAATVYVRFRRAKVARTIPRPAPRMHLAVDVDARGAVIGVEAVGIKEIQIGRLLKMAAVQAPNIDFSQVRYLPAGLGAS